MSLAVGDCFDSFEQFYTVLKEYCIKNNVQFIKADSKFVTNANTHLKPNSTPYPEKLKYTRIIYCCKYGRLSPEERERLGLARARSHRKSYNEGCQAELFVSIDKKINKLRVRKLVEEHSHQRTPGEIDFPREADIVYPRGHESIVQRKSARIRKNKGLSEYEWWPKTEYLETSAANPGNMDSSMELYTPIQGGDETKSPQSERGQKRSHDTESENRITESEDESVPTLVEAAQPKHSMYFPSNQFQNQLWPADIGASFTKALKDLSDAASKTTQTTDPDDLFFASISNEIKMLPKRVKSNLKLEILSLVNERILENET